MSDTGDTPEERERLRAEKDEAEQLAKVVGIFIERIRKLYGRYSSCFLTQAALTCGANDTEPVCKVCRSVASTFRTESKAAPSMNLEQVLVVQDERAVELARRIYGALKEVRVLCNEHHSCFLSYDAANCYEIDEVCKFCKLIVAEVQGGSSDERSGN